MFKEEITQLLRERRQAPAPDREKMQAKLAETEREITNLLAAIKRGILTVSTKAELEKLEAERARLQQALHGPEKKAEVVTHLLPDLKERFRSLVADIAMIAARNLDKARAALKDLLSSQSTLRPCSDGQKRYLMVEISGNYAGLLRLAGMQNKFGGGQGS